VQIHHSGYVYLHETANPDRPASRRETIVMIRNLLIAAAFSGLSTVAFAQSNPHFVGEGSNPHVAYDAPSANVVGSADAFVTGGPDSTHYETRQVFRTQSPSLARNPSQIEAQSSN
jgi:hypothetical protein